MADPPCTGFTARGKPLPPPKRSGMISSAFAAPRSLNALAGSTNCGGQTTKDSCLPYTRRIKNGMSALFHAALHDAGRDPTYGIRKNSKSAGTAPSSPPAPCMQMKATSGFSARNVSTRCASASSVSTSKPDLASDSDTKRPERSEKFLSNEVPPIITATLDATTTSCFGLLAI